MSILHSAVLLQWAEPVCQTSGRRGGKGAVRARCGAAASAWGGGLPVWGSPLPGLLRHEPLQQGQLVHGAELHGQLSLLYLTASVKMAAKQSVQCAWRLVDCICAASVIVAYLAGGAGSIEYALQQTGLLACGGTRPIVLLDACSCRCWSCQQPEDAMSFTFAL